MCEFVCFVIMPRKNQKRKNINSQSGRRKSKPIKFNPNEIENEQKCLGMATASVAANDAAATDEENDDEQEAKGSDSIQEDGKNNTNNLSSIAADGSENDHTNQIDKIDDVQNETTIIIRDAISSNNSLSNRTFNCTHF